MLEKFVCVRVVQANTLDLASFQFDYGLTWAVFFMNADRTIYGRYGTRTRLNNPDDATDAGFRKAALAALELHRGYPGNKASLQGKTGPAPRHRIARDYPSLRRFPDKVDPGAGERNNPTCMHCHEIRAAEYAVYRQAKRPIPEEEVWPYPMPDGFGLTLDPEERCIVKRVAPGSAAERAGLKARDEILRLEGQPLVSVADVQWILHGAKDGATLTAEVRRGDRTESLSITLPPGWRRSGDLTWRSETGAYFAFDLLLAEALSEEDRRKLGLAEAATGLRVRFLASVLEAAGLRRDDVIVAVGGDRKRIVTLSQFLAHVAQNVFPGGTLEVTVLRSGKEERLELKLP